METFLRAGLGNALLATILALGAAVAGTFLRRPAVRHGLWLLVLLKLVTPPLWVIPLGVPAPLPSVDDSEPGWSEQGQGRDAIEAEWSAAPISAEPAVERPAWLRSWDWTRLAATTWLTGTFVTLAVTGLRIRRWNRLLRLVEPASDEVQGQVERLAKEMGLARPPTTCWFPGPAAPMLWALGGEARLIVPRELWGRLDEPQRTTLLVHELAHLRRKDHWVRVVELLATAFYWWLPLAWVARWALREAEEQCCDAWVVWTCPDALRAYAETLLDTVDFLSETGRAAPMAASGFGQAHHLKRRVTMIMQGKTPRGLGWTGLLTMLGLSALLLPLSPTWAQKADGEERADSESEVEVVREVEVAIDDSESAELDVLKRKLAEEILRLRSIEKQVAEKVSGRTKSIKSVDGPKKEEGEPSQKASTLKRNAIIELRTDRPDPARSLSTRPKLFEAKEIQLRFNAEHRAVIDREVARAKAEVERARAQLHRAESQLERLGADLKKSHEAMEKERDQKSEDSPEEGKDRDKVSANLQRKLHQDHFRVIVRKHDELKKLEDEKKRMLFKEFSLHSPEKDRRIADLEKKLDELINEVKNLKSERGDSKK